LPIEIQYKEDPIGEIPVDHDLDGEALLGLGDKKSTMVDIEALDDTELVKHVLSWHPSSYFLSD
jgi:hypothetical protein